MAALFPNKLVWPVVEVAPNWEDANEKLVFGDVTGVIVIDAAEEVAAVTTFAEVIDGVLSVAAVVVGIDGITVMVTPLPNFGAVVLKDGMINLSPEVVAAVVNVLLKAGSILISLAMDEGLDDVAVEVLEKIEFCDVGKRRGDGRGAIEVGALAGELTENSGC